MPIDALPHDARAVRIISPDSVQFNYGMTTPEAIVRNVGTTIDTIPVVFEIGAVYRDSTEVILSPGDSTSLVFSDVALHDLGTYPVLCYTLLADDPHTANDTTKSVAAIIEDPNVPIVYSVTPNSCGNLGGRVVTITGSNFMEGALVNLVGDGHHEVGHQLA